MARLKFEWECPKCKMRVETLAGIYPPVCGDKSHSSKQIEMVNIRGLGPEDAPQ